MTKKIVLALIIVIIIGVALFLGLSTTEQEGETRVGFSLREFLPFGKSEETTETPVRTDSEGTPITNTLGPVPRLRKISSEPVAGAVIFNQGTTSIVRFVEKGTGNVYEVSSNSTEKRRLTNTTIPKITRAFWLPLGSGFLAQTLMSESTIIETNFVKLNKSVTSSSSPENLTPYETVISKLPTDIKEIAVKPDGSKIFYYTIVNGGSRWYLSSPDGTGSTLVYSHPLTEWLPRWTNGDTVSIQTKSSSKNIGYAYDFNTQNRTLSKIGLGTYGLSLNPDSSGTFNLVSSGGKTPEILAYDIKNDSYLRTKVNSLADKCVWLKKESVSIYCAVPNGIPNGDYPENWYQGKITTEDSIRKVNVADNVFYVTLNLSAESGQKIDVTDISISPDDSHLIFRNKIDGFLWMLRLEE